MPAKTYVQTTINGEHVDFLCEPRQSLLECLRDVIGLTGSKEGYVTTATVEPALSCSTAGSSRRVSSWA